MTIDPDTDRLMTVGEIAEFFSVTQYTVRQWINNGTLAGVKVNNKWRVARSAVVAYAQALYGEKK